MGHLMEPIVAQCYAQKTGNTIIEDTGLYQHAAYPYALANLDYRLEESGRQGVLECSAIRSPLKRRGTTSDMKLEN
jgi:predicted phage-related endonuclease